MSTFRGTRTLGLASLFEPIRSRAVPQLILLNKKVRELAESGALERFGEKVARNMEKIINVVRRVALAIHHLNQNSGGNLLKWAGIFAGVGLAFKVGLAVPIIRASWMIGKSFIKNILIPFKSAFIGIFALIGAFDIGRALEKTFDLSNVIARAEADFKYWGELFKNLLKFTVTLNPKGYDKAAKQLSADRDKMMARLKPKGSMDFWGELKDSFKKTMDDAGSIGDKMLNGLIPDSIKGVIDMLHALPDIVLPQLAAQMPDFEAGVEKGVRKGLTSKKHMRINGGGGSDFQKVSDRIRNEILGKIRTGTDQTNMAVKDLVNKGAIVF
jgi:hypothetical protein